MTSDDSQNERRAEIQSVDRAVSVLEFLSRHGWSGVTEVAVGLGIHKSTAYRLLATLKDRGLVEQDLSTERYRLGLGLVFLASTVAADLDVVRHARPICRRLGERTQETVTISVLAGDEVITVDQTMPSSSVLNVDWTGKRFPLHCGSDGKVLLAHLPEGRQREILTGPLPPFTENTIVDPITLRAQLQAVRADGYAYSVEELEIGLNGVAAPICTRGGTVVAAVSVSGPAFRLTADDVPAVGELTRDAAQEISRRLGFASKSDERSMLRGMATEG